jgi:hypothetical protein
MKLDIQYSPSRRIKRSVFLLVILSCTFVLPPTVFAKKEKEKEEVEEIPKPTVLDSARFLVLREGKVVQFGRYKIVRSKFSNRIFSGGLQRALTEGVEVDAYKEMKPKVRRKLYGAKHGHHFEFSNEGAFEKYRGWSVVGATRTDYRLIRRGEGYLHRSEGGGGSGSNKIAAPAGTMPFDAGQFVLVRMAFERARKAGGSLSIVHPQTGALGTLTVALGEGNQYTLNGLGQTGRVVLDDSGRIVTYHFGDLEFFREGSR